MHVVGVQRLDRPPGLGKQIGLPWCLSWCPSRLPLRASSRTISKCRSELLLIDFADVVARQRLHEPDFLRYCRVLDVLFRPRDELVLRDVTGPNDDGDDPLAPLRIRDTEDTGLVHLRVL